MSKTPCPPKARCSLVLVINFTTVNTNSTEADRQRVALRVLINPEITTRHTDAQKDAGDKEMLTPNLIIFETADYSTSHSHARLLLVMSPTGTALNHRLQPAFTALVRAAEDNNKQEIISAMTPPSQKSSDEYGLSKPWQITPSRVLKLGWYMTFLSGTFSGMSPRGKIKALRRGA